MSRNGATERTRSLEKTVEDMIAPWMWYVVYTQPLMVQANYSCTDMRLASLLAYAALSGIISGMNMLRFFRPALFVAVLSAIQLVVEIERK